MQELSQNGAMTAYIGKDFTQTNTVIDISVSSAGDRKSNLARCWQISFLSMDASDRNYSCINQSSE